MDYRLYHGINQFVLDHDWVGRVLSVVRDRGQFRSSAIATFGLWFLARPGGPAQVEARLGLGARLGRLPPC